MSGNNSFVDNKNTLSSSHLVNINHNDQIKQHVKQLKNILQQLQLKNEEEKLQQMYKLQKQLRHKSQSTDN